MRVGATRNNTETLAGQGFRENSCVDHNLPGVVAELRLHRLKKANRFCRDDMHEWTTLHTRKNDFVDRSSKFLLAENHACTRAAQGFVRGRGDYLGVGHRRRMHPASYQSGKMRHVDQIESANFIRDLPHAREINDSWICAAPANNQLGTFLLG